MTTKSDITEDISSDESVTKENVHKEEQNDGKFKINNMYCGSLNHRQ